MALAADGGDHRAVDGLHHGRWLGAGIESVSPLPSFALEPIPTVCFAIYPSSKVLFVESSVTLVES